MYSNRYYRKALEEDNKVVKIKTNIFHLNNRMSLGIKEEDEESIMEELEDEKEDAIKRKIEHLKEDEKGGGNINPVQYTKVITSIPSWALQTFSCCGKSAVDDEEESKIMVVQQRNIEAFFIIAGTVTIILLIYVFGKTVS